MKLVVVLLLLTDILLTCQGLDDDEDENRKFSVTFFQFNPRDLGILGGHKKEHAKRNYKRSEADTAPPAKNESAVRSQGESNKPTNASSVTADSTGTLNNTSVGGNATGPLQNMSANHAKDNITVPETPDMNIMHALIDLAVHKNDSSPTDVAAANKSEAHNATAVTKDNVNTASTANNATSTENKTVLANTNVTKRNHVPAKHNVVLNPNPKPSDPEAMLNVKKPKQIENKEHDHTIHSENTTQVKTGKDKHEILSNSVTMVKNKNIAADKGSEQVAKEVVATGKEKKKEATDKDVEEKKKHSKANTKNTKSEITPIPEVANGTFDVKSTTPVKSNPAEVDERVKEHRTSVAEFVPLYHSTTQKDHSLSFQIGSMKHPKHNIHPKCHACPLNSTYKECVKKSTLKECNEGLNNICFTKSTKQKSIITYEMGCSDHNNCVHAKAFPCKDDREHCFTCCQFDRCNSSPHHGDYELDEINLEELGDPIASKNVKDTTILDTKSATGGINGSWMAYASTIFVLLILHL